MAEDIQTYVFDFEKEVATLRNDFVHLRDNVLFADVEIIPPQEGSPSAEVAVRQLIGLPMLREEDRGSLPNYIAEDEKSKFPLNCSSSGVLSYGETVPDHTGYAVILLAREPFTALFGEENRDLMHLFTLYHETAHTLFNGKAPAALDKSSPYRECQADAFATINLLRRFGNDVLPLVSLIGWFRAFEAISANNANHLTIPVIDKIIVDSTREGKAFAQISPNEIIAESAQYTRKLTPHSADIATTNEFYTKVCPSGKSALESFALTAILLAKNDLSFYVGARFWLPFLTPEGLAINGETLKIGETARQQIQTAFGNRGFTTDFHEMFNKNAAPAPRNILGLAHDPLTLYLFANVPKPKKQIGIKLATGA